MAKYHNFKLLPSVGSTRYFVSKCGHDSNDGTDPNAPRKSIPSVPASNSALFIIGTGHYTGGTVAQNGANSPALWADGKVILDSMQNGSGSLSEAIGITFRNWNPLKIRSGNATDCVLENCQVTTYSTNNGYVAKGTVAKQCNFTANASYGICLQEAVIVNCTGAVYYVRDCDVDSDTELIITSPMATALRNTNYRGLVRLLMADGVTYKYYAVKDQYTGTPQEAGYSAEVSWLSEAQLTADGYGQAVAGLNANLTTCLNRPAKYNDASGGDYTYQADSPNVRRSSTGTNLGGQKIAASIFNTDDGNMAGTIVEPTAAINTTIPSAFELNDGYTEGYVDYVFFNSGLTLTNLDLKDVFNFNTDIAGGQVGNKNVSDAEPVTSDYASYTTTIAASSALNLLTVAAGKVAVGQHVRVNGQCREVISKAVSGGNDVLTLNSNLLATVGTGVIVTFGSVLQLAAINPNRLTVFMRTRSVASKPTFPFVDSEWDNELDPVYGKAGYLFNQEINTKPVLYIDGLEVYGSGDSDAPVGLAEQELAPQWIHVRVYKRNNYSHKGVLS